MGGTERDRKNMKNKIIGILIVTLLIATAVIPMSGENNTYISSTFGEVLDQHQDWSDDCVYFEQEWQEFVPTLDNLARVDVKIAQWYSGSPDLIMTIEKPLGTVLTTKSMPATSIPSPNCDWVIFDVPDISLIPGSSYYIKLTAPIGSEYGWGIAYNNLYPKGTSSQYPADWCFRTYSEEVENQRPTVTITYPNNGDTVSGTIIITGEAHDPEGDSNLEWVKVKFDDGYWQYASGTSMWNYVLDTTTLNDGVHSISAKTFDGILESYPAIVNVTVSNEGDKKLSLNTNRDSYVYGEPVAIEVKNIGNEPVQFSVFPGIEIRNSQGEKVFPLSSNDEDYALEPGESEMYIWDVRNPLGEYLEPDEYTITTDSELGPLEPVKRLSYIGKGYVILVAGDSKYGSSCKIDTRCDDATVEIYEDLKTMGYTDDEICFLNKFRTSDYRVDLTGSSANLEWAITTWASSRVNNEKPLYIIMFDHGGDWSGGYLCSCYPGNLNDKIYAYDLNYWIDDLFSSNNCFVHVWVMACHSGAFINDLSRLGFVTITSTNTDRNTHGAGGDYHELFTNAFWPQIVAGSSWLDAFNSACFHSHQNSIGYVDSYGNIKPPNLPLLDDNGDGLGHGLYWAHFTSSDIDDAYAGDLPRLGDGTYAARIHMDWVILHPSLIALIRTSPHYFIGPMKDNQQNSDTVELWAEVEGKEFISNVTAYMALPEVTQPVEDSWLETTYDEFEMFDTDNDGKYTVDIPRSTFEPYLSLTEDFDFLIIVEGENGQKCMPLWTGVSLSTKEKYEDSVKPFVKIHYPRDGEIVGGEINIRGLASDNVELGRISVIFDDITIVDRIPPSSCHYTFEGLFDTNMVEVGNHTINVEIQDTSGNSFTHDIDVLVVRSPYSPNKPTGPMESKPGKKNTYETKTIHPNQEEIWNMWDWGDGSNSGWLGPYSSNELVSQSHKWDEEGMYMVRVKARDKYGAESPWSDSLSVSMPKIKSVNTPFLTFLENHPNLFPLLRQILGL